MNKNDLKWCKDEWDLSSPNFSHIKDLSTGKFHSKCTKGDQPENFVPNGQDIMEEDKENGHIYNCFNRADEDPFKKIGYNQSEDEGNKSWSDWVGTPCHLIDFPHWRCLGKKPSQCVFTFGGYI